MIRIITDTASDITAKQAQELGIELVQIGIHFEGETMPQTNLEEFKSFYKRLEQVKDLPTTSQPTPGQYLEIIENPDCQDDEFIIITMSSGLSGTYQSAVAVSGLVENSERVAVVDSANIVLSQRQMVYRAIELRDQEKSLEEIVDALEHFKHQFHIIALINTLTYLKKGGRVPASLATVGNLLRLKPVLCMKEKKLHSLTQARGYKAGIKQLLSELEKFPIQEGYNYMIGYTGFDDYELMALDFVDKAKEHLNTDNIEVYPVNGVIGTHLGPGSLIISYVKKH